MLKELVQRVNRTDPGVLKKMARSVYRADQGVYGGGPGCLPSLASVFSIYHTDPGCLLNLFTTLI